MPPRFSPVQISRYRNAQLAVPSTVSTQGAGAAAGAATGGASLLATFAVQGALLIGGTLLSKLFGERPILAGKPQTVGSLTTEWSPNPAHHYPYGTKVRSGGSGITMICKHSRDNSWVSNRLDVLVAYAEGPLQDPNALADEEDSLILWMDGWRIELERPVLVPGVPPTLTDWWEPVSDSPFSGRLRVYWNNKADGTQGVPLQNYMQTYNDDMDDADNNTYANAWTLRHKLTGLSYAHIIVNLKDGIDGNINTKRDSINRVRITAPPRNYVFQFPGLKDIPLADGTPVNTGMATDNSANIFAHWATNALGLSQDLIDTDAAIRAYLRAPYNDSFDITRTWQEIEWYIDPNSGDREFREIERTRTENVTVRPFAFNGVIRGNDDPVRIFQVFETLWGRKIGFQGGKVIPIIGQHYTAVRPGRTINEEDLWQRPQPTNNPDLSARANAIGGSMLYCIQSESNSSYPIPRANNVGLNVEDRRFIEKNLPTAAYINDFYQAQQLTRTRAILLNQRREIVLPIHYTPERAEWMQGEEILVNIPASGILNKIFLIEALAYVPGQGLIVYAKEENETDPWAIDHTGSPFFLFSEDRIPREVDIGAIPPPDRIEITREDVTLNNLPYTWLNVEFNDPEYAELRLEVEWDTQSHDGEPDPMYGFRSDFGSIPPARFQVEGHGSIYIRFRWRLDHDTVSDWTEEIEVPEVRDLPAIPQVSGLSATPGGIYSDLAWYPGEFIGFDKTQIRYGTGSVPGENVIGQPFDVAAPGSFTKIEGLDLDTEYWAQARFFNTEGDSNDWDGGRSVVFSEFQPGYTFTFQDATDTQRTATYRGIFADEAAAVASIGVLEQWDIYRDEALDAWRIYTGAIWVDYNVQTGVGNFAGDFPDEAAASDAITADGQFAIYPDDANVKKLYEVIDYTPGSSAAASVVFTTTSAERFVFDPTTEYIPVLKKGEAIGTVPPFQLAATIGGVGDITYEIDNTLISGLNGLPTDTQFDGNNRRVTGTPSAGGEFNFGYKATDESDPPRSITRIITVQVQDDEAALPFRFDLASQSTPGLKKEKRLAPCRPSCCR